MKEIKSFDDIVLKYQLSKDTLKGIEEQLYHESEEKKFMFTDLQNKAFNTPGFWRGDNDIQTRHIIVQGATSSGKTLISEMAILDCLKSRKKSIVLVPLKAMVRERYEHFKNDLEPQGTTQVYASSSDFQEHDGNIVRGDYEVAVIVYEKFFAMLAQPENNMLNDCALLVVDELQMLSSNNRGPKLEIGIQKVLRNNKSSEKNAAYTRIMCLTTCDCKVNYIKKWLTISERGREIEPILIDSFKRPIGLKEHVIQVDGKWKMHYERGEWDSDAEDKLYDEGELDEISGYEEKNNIDLAKRELLKVLLKKIYNNNPKAKVLVFANGRKRTHDIADFLAKQDIMPFGQLSKETGEKIDAYDGDEYQSILKQSLLPRRIAFHNAALSTALREFIEDLFQKDGELRLVVATETLTVGMNMPVDVMILFDAEVFRGNGVATALTSQEYKNFVGRAGRLGQTNCKGESYIFAVTKTDANKYWDNYVNSRAEEITSALINNGEKAQAPYYLSLMEPQVYEAEKLEELQKESFSQKCNGQSIDMKEVVKELKKANLCQISKSNDEDDEGDGEEYIEKEYYELSDLGKMMAPYALNLDTCKKIRRFFFNGGMKKMKDGWQEFPDEGKGGLPSDITDEDIKNDRYLLDILYIICCTKEITQLSQLKIPSSNSNPERSRMALDKIEEELRKMIDTDKHAASFCEVWPNSPLLYMLENGYENETENKECIMRAILLYHWTKGKTISEIKKETGFDKFVLIVNGDMARMAEAVSYQIEAIYHCYGGFRGYVRFKPNALSGLYGLSTRVNYGMPRNLVIIANCHLHGLDRRVVLKIGEKAKSSGKYDSPANFLKEASIEELSGVITEQQRNDLLRRIDELYLRDNLEVLLDNIRKFSRDSSISEEICNAIKILHKVGNEIESEQLLEPLSRIFYTDEMLLQSNRNGFFNKRAKVQLIGDKNIALVTLGENVFLIGAYAGRTDTLQEFNNYVSNQYGKGKNILLVLDEMTLEKVYPGQEEGVWELKDEKNNTLIYQIHLIMTFKVFSELLAQDIALYDVKAEALSEMLKDTQGVFRPAGLQALYPLLQNYDSNANQHPKIEEQESPVLRILCDRRMGSEHKDYDRISKELQHQEIPFRVLRWGEYLDNEQPADAPTLLYLTWDTVEHSKSIYKFINRLKKNKYKNTYAIFESEELFRKWGTSNPELACHELPYCIKTDDMKEIVNVARYLIKRFRREDQLIGVSYAHEKVLEQERATVIQFKEIIKKINERFGESAVLYDQNPSCKNYFDGNGAIPATLEMYRKCKYYIVLDDQFYDNSPNCRKEKKVIQEQLKNMQSRHLWFLHPDNDKHCSLFCENKDYSTRLQLNDDSTNEAAQGIIQSIMELEKMPSLD